MCIPAWRMSRVCSVGCGGVKGGNPRSLCTFKKVSVLLKLVDSREEETVTTVIPQIT